MKSNRLSKKMLSVLLAFVMVITSLPLMFVGALEAGDYDPTPYWSDDGGSTEMSSKEISLVARLNDDNSISVYFPRAYAREKWDESGSTEVQGYVVSLTELTDQRQADRDPLIEMYFPLDMVTVNDSPDAMYPREITLSSELVEKALRFDEDDGGFKSNCIYDVGVSAIGSEYWVSNVIHTILNRTPYYNLTGDFSPDENWIAREMLRFEQRYDGDKSMNGGTISTDGVTLTKDVDYVSSTASQTDGDIHIDGRRAEWGTDGSAAFRLYVANAYSGTPFTFTTTWSRGHYDFAGAEEVWFWVDFRDVQFDKIAFNLRVNGKNFNIWYDGSQDQLSLYGNEYSTKSVNGANAGTLGGIYYQDEAGLWEETTMTDGYLQNFGGYRGFIRIPLQYFVLQTNEYITADNEGISSDYAYASKNANGQRSFVESHMFMQGTPYKVNQLDGSVIDGEAVSMQFVDVVQTGSGGNFRDIAPNASKNVYRLLVNAAGTPINDCLLVQQRYTSANWYSFPYWYDFTSSMGYMLAEGTPTSYVDNSDGSVTYQIDRDNAVKATQDLVGAGFDIEGWTDDSIKNAFFFDRVVFMRNADANSEANYGADGAVLDGAPVQFSTERSDFANDRGYKVGIYYDRTKQIPAAIASFIDEYLDEYPSLVDAQTIEFIENMVELYKDCFPYDTVEQNMQSLQAQYPEEYALYQNTKDFVSRYLGEDKNYYTAAQEFERYVEMLPDHEMIDVDDEATREIVERLHNLYMSFDIDSLNLIGDSTEQKFLSIYRHMVGDEVKAGHSIGAYPFIPFNTFETRYTVGETAYRYYNDNPANSTNKPGDQNNIGKFTVYPTDGRTTGSGGWYPYAYNASDGNTVNDTYLARVSAKITNDGFDDSKGATVNFDGDLSNVYGVLSVSYAGRTAASFSALQGLDLSAIQLNNRSADGTSANDETRYGGSWANSFVMYLDYSKVRNVAMNVQFIVENASGGDEVYYFATGNAGEDRIWMLDENGEWTNIPINTALADSDTSTIIPNDANPDNSLQGYKGFIRIPLSKFRNSSGTILDNVLDQVKIKRAHISFWDPNGENVGSEVTVDAMGFTYDHTLTDRLSADPAAELKSDNGLSSDIVDFDRYFGVETDDTTAFKQAVGRIDPYAGKDAFLAAYNACLAMYGSGDGDPNALSPYQRTLEDVTAALEHLEEYAPLAADYDNLIATDEWRPLYTTASELNSALAVLPDGIKNYDANTSGTRTTQLYDYETGTINYALFGFTGPDDERIQQAIDAYEKGYMRLSPEERASFGGLTPLTNAYNAARRIRLLEQDLADKDAFMQTVLDLYTESRITIDYDGDGVDELIPVNMRMRTINPFYMDENNISDTSRINPAIADAVYEYYYMSFFAKAMLSNTQDEEELGKKYDLVSDALLDVYLNARPRTLLDASKDLGGGNYGTYDDYIGGIAKYVEEAHKSHKTIEDKTAARTYLLAQDLADLEYNIGEYEHSMQRFQNIESSYNEYLHMINILPVADVDLRDINSMAGVDITERGYVLTSDNEAKALEVTHYANLQYVAARQGHSVTLRVSTDGLMKQISGVDEHGDLKFSVAELSSSPDESGIYSGDLKTFTNRFNATDRSGTYRQGLTVSVNEDDVADIPAGVIYEGKITLEVYDTDDLTAYAAGELTDWAGNPVEPEPIAVQEIPVRFTSSASFFSVSVPTEIDVPFKATEAQADVTVVHTMAIGDTLNVNLATSDPLVMEFDPSEVPAGTAQPDPLPTIAYGASLDTITCYGDENFNQVSKPIVVTVDPSEWEGKYVNTYISRQLTVTADFDHTEIVGP